MSSSRESSPDWLREFKAPSQNLVTHSSDSESSLLSTPKGSHLLHSDEPAKYQSKQGSVPIDIESHPLHKAKKRKPPKTEKNNNLKEDVADAYQVNAAEEDVKEKPMEPPMKKVALLTLSSDSESSLPSTPKEPDPFHSEEPMKHRTKQDYMLIDSERSPVNKAKKWKSPKIEKNNNLTEDVTDAHQEDAVDEDVKEKPVEPPVSSRLPLVFSDRVQRTKVLVECDGDSIDLSGDVGAVGRIVIAKSQTGYNEMLLDLKGTIYKSKIVPSRTFGIVSVGQSEAKIEAIMNDFIQLEPQSNVFEAETMIEGTLEGFSFDSDEGEKIPKSSTHQGDQNNEPGDQATEKTKKKEKPAMVQKKAKTAGKPAKKGTRKPQAVRKAKKSK